MAASMTHPVYTAKIVKETTSEKNKKITTTTTTYPLKNVTTDLVISHPEKELSEKVTLSLMNIKVGSSSLRSIIKLKDKLYVYADTGSGAKKVFSGFVYERAHPEDADANEVKLVCYDKLIYLQKSKDNLFVKKGKKTKDIITSLAKKWGIKINYKYGSISHPKLVFQSKHISDILITILEEAKKKLGRGYTIYLDNNTMVIDYEGNNSPVYKIAKGENSIRCNYVQTMEDMVTKVKIVKAETVKKGSGTEETGKYLTVTSVSKNTDKYGTLQDIIVKKKDDKLSEVKKEANEILKENATPKEESEVDSIDIPWVKKGDQIYIQSGSMNGYYIVKSVEHDAMDNIMSLEVKKYE